MPHRSLQIDNSGLPLLDAIYSAGADFSLWPKALVKLADTVGGHEAAITTVGPQGMPWVSAPRTDPAYLALYRDYYYAQDYIAQRMVARGVGAAVTQEMVTTAAEQNKSAVYSEWARPQGYHHLLGGLVMAQQSWSTMLIVTGRRSYSSEATSLYASLAGHIARAVQLNIRLAQSDQRLAASEQVLQALPRAALVLDADARLLLANPAGEVLMRPGGGLHLRDGRLCAHDLSVQQLLRSLVLECVNPQLRHPHQAQDPHIAQGEILLPRLGHSPRRLLVSPLRHTESSDASHMIPAMAAVLVVEAQEPEISVAERLQQRFGLTPAEARLATEMAQGDGKVAAAERLGISFSTARSHLSRIFDKTGVRRQAELVRLMAQLDSPALS
jgi:DNA-binding CsgD family transcriptional regulator